jgi:ABC-type multidrug transport system ATPase subunit
MALAQRLCHRILVVNEGRKVVEGATDEVIQQFGGHHRTTEIRLAGAVDHGTLARLCEAFPFASVTTETETTTLSWSDTHPQQKLLELLNLVDGEGLSILHAGQREATLEEVFVHLTAGRGSPA